MLTSSSVILPDVERRGRSENDRIPASDLSSLSSSALNSAELGGEALEAALASRPGRVDQAIEFPLPDNVGREKLVQFYAKGITLPADLVQEIVRRTDGVSAAFIKELLRRIVQFHIEREGTEINTTDVDLALDEMLFSGGSLNLKLLGAGNLEADHQTATT